MAFTYNLAATGADLSVSKVRLHLGDQVEGSGVLPNGSNLEDAEITVLLDAEGSDIMRAVAAGCELLARHWSSVADLSVGPRSESFSQVAAGYAARGADLRREYGGAATTFSTEFNRADGYEENEAGNAGYTPTRINWWQTV